MGPNISVDAEEIIHDKQTRNQGQSLAYGRQDDSPAGLFGCLQVGDGNIVETDEVAADFAEDMGHCSNQRSL